MSWFKSISLLVGLLLIAGCAQQKTSEQALAQARASFQTVRDDPDALRSAPRDVIRAGESLARADQLAGYWGSSADVEHFAYLSQRYSEIAMQHSELAKNNLQAEKLAMQREDLQLTLREAKLLSLQQKGEWVEEQMLSLATTETSRGLVLTLGDVLFAGGSADLSAGANRTLLKLAQFLQLNPRRIIRVEGYTDTQGDEGTNLILSKARAQAVANLLVDLGIDAQRMQVEGFGEAYPVADNASMRGRAQNRRVEVVFSDAQGQLGQSR